MSETETAGLNMVEPRWNVVVIAKIVGLVTGAVVIIVFNALIIVLITKFHKLRTWTNCLLVGLAVADLMVGLIGVPTHLLAEFNVFGRNEPLCLLFNFPTVLVPTASLLFLIAASLERFLAIMFPLRYPSLVSRRRIMSTVVCIWFYTGTLALLPIVGWNNMVERRDSNVTLLDCNFAAVMPGPYVGVFVAGNLFPGMFFLLVLNAKLFLVAKSHRVKLAHSTPTPRTGNVSSIGESWSQTDSRQTTSKTLQKSKRVISILLVLGHLSVLSYIPLFIAFVMDYNWFTITMITEWKAPYLLYASGTFLGALNSIANPLILGFANKEIRSHFRLIFSNRRTRMET